MSRANLPAAPTQWQPVASTTGVTYMTGLTIREHFAAMAMQGYLANPDWTQEGHERVARNCVLSADALIAELAKAQS